jgi:predicted ArsR family transcriptional regulator
MREFDAAGPAFEALADDLRRRLYVYVRSQGRPVNREEAASSAGISTKLAAFHLDKLVDRALLKTSYARPAGRTGRGAGRTAKYYEPTETSLEISIPARRYDLAGSVLLDALITQGDKGGNVVRKVSGERGFEAGQEVGRTLRAGPVGAKRAMSILRSVLEKYGYEPYVDDGGALALRNCPFDALAERSREIICGAMNVSFLQGLVHGLGSQSITAVLTPTPGACCVRLVSSFASEDRTTS